MSDDLDLRGIDQRHEPDSRFRAALQRRLAAIVAGTDPGSVTTSRDPATSNLEPHPKTPGTSSPVRSVSHDSDTETEIITLTEATPTRTRRWLVLAAATLVAVVAGIALVTTTSSNNNVSDAPTTTVTTQTVSFVVQSANDIRVTFTMPNSWGLLDGLTAGLLAPPEPPDAEAPPTTAPDENAEPPGPRAPIGAYSTLTEHAAVVQFDSVYNIYSHGCGMTALDPPVGPTVDDLVMAWANVPELGATTPVDITVDGYTGKQIELTLPDFDYASCNAAGVMRFALWDDSAEPCGLCAPPGMVAASNARPSPNRHFQMLVLDVDGTRLLIAASADPNTSLQERADLAVLLASIQIG